MSTFSELLLELSSNHGEVDLPDNWRQGRTTYGGLSAALMLAEITDNQPDLPPLRSTQVNFIGPAAGVLKASHTVVRQGKNSLVIDSKLYSGDNIAASAIFIFAMSRPSNLLLEYPVLTDVKAPEDCDVFIPDRQGPVFLEHFDRLLVAGSKPFSGSKTADFTLWMRHRDIDAHSSATKNIIALIALADAPPPATLACATKLVPLSTMNWHISMLAENPQTEDGWWLLRSRSQHLQNGYCHQQITIWNSSGLRVIEAVQFVAIFD